MKFFLDLISVVGGVLSMLLSWARRNPAVALCLVLLAIIVWLWIGWGNAADLAAQRKGQSAAWKEKFRNQKAEMVKFIGQVRDARAQAAQLDQDNDARVQREWATAFKEQTNDYQDVLSAARADLARKLRGGTRTGAVGSGSGGGATPLSAIPTLSSGPVRAGDAAIVDGADLDACTVNTIGLEHLIAAWDRAAAIDVNAPSKGR